MIRRDYPNLSPEIEVVGTGKWKARKDWSPEEFSRIRKTAVEGNKAGGDGAGSSEGLGVASHVHVHPWAMADRGDGPEALSFSFRLALESFGLQLTAAFGSFSDAIFRLLCEAQIWALVHSCRWGSGLASFKCHTAESASREEAGRCAAMICGCHFCAQSPGCSLTGDHSSSTAHPGMAVLYSRSWGALSLLNTFIHLSCFYAFQSQCGKCFHGDSSGSCLLGARVTPVLPLPLKSDLLWWMECSRRGWRGRPGSVSGEWRKGRRDCERPRARRPCRAAPQGLTHRNPETGSVCPFKVPGCGVFCYTAMGNQANWFCHLYPQRVLINASTCQEY